MKKIKCNLCGKDDSEVILRCHDRCFGISGEYNLVKCRACGLVYLNPQPQENELSRHYPRDYDQFDVERRIFSQSSLYDTLRAAKRALIGVRPTIVADRARDESKKKYLDFGCGGCENISRVRREHPAWDYFGLDISPWAYESCKKHGFDIFLGSLEQAKYPDNFFDIVDMKGVLEHLPDPMASVREVYRILKRGGSLQLSLPNINSLGFKVFKSYWFNLECPRHLFLFSPATLSAMLSETGFSVEYLRPEKNVKELISSVDYILGRGNAPIHPLVWHAVSPLAALIARLHKSGLMVTVAKKS